jgi:hypothetical protein
MLKIATKAHIVRMEGKTAFVNKCRGNEKIAKQVIRIFGTNSNLKASTVAAIIITGSAHVGDKKCLIRKDTHSFARKEMKATLIPITDNVTKIEYIFGTLFDMLHEIGMNVTNILDVIECNDIILFSKKQAILVTIFVDIRKLHWNEGSELMDAFQGYPIQDAISKMEGFENILKNIDMVEFPKKGGIVVTAKIPTVATVEIVETIDAPPPPPHKQIYQLLMSITTALENDRNLLMSITKAFENNKSLLTSITSAFEDISR